MEKKKFTIPDLFNIVSKMSIVEVSYLERKYKSNVLTNLESDIIQSLISLAFFEKIDQTISIALRSKNIAREGSKVDLHHKKQNTNIVKSLVRVQNKPVPLISTYQYQLRTNLKTYPALNNHIFVSLISSFFQAHHIFTYLAARPNLIKIKREYDDNDFANTIN